MFKWKVISIQSLLHDDFVAEMDELRLFVTEPALWNSDLRPFRPQTLNTVTNPLRPRLPGGHTWVKRVLISDHFVPRPCVSERRRRPSAAGAWVKILTGCVKPQTPPGVRLLLWLGVTGVVTLGSAEGHERLNQTQTLGRRHLARATAHHSDPVSAVKLTSAERKLQSAAGGGLTGTVSSAHPGV